MEPIKVWLVGILSIFLTFGILSPAFAITLPEITAPANQTFEATAVLSPLTEADYGIAIGSSIFPPVTITSDAPATFPLGETIITWTATDANGNPNTATQTVTIVDTTPPEITAPANQTFEATAVLSPLTEADYGIATGSDIFTPVTITSDAPATFPLAETIITWTATDANGNPNTATQTVTIVDTTLPETPAQATQNLIDFINGLGLPNGVENSLTANLKNIVKLLEDGNPNNDGAVCGKLGGFINKVDAKEKNGQLTTEQAAQLSQQANAIKTSLSCP